MKHSDNIVYPSIIRFYDWFNVGKHRISDDLSCPPVTIDLKRRLIYINNCENDAIPVDSVKQVLINKWTRIRTAELLITLHNERKIEITSFCAYTLYNAIKYISLPCNTAFDYDVGNGYKILYYLTSLEYFTLFAIFPCMLGIIIYRNMIKSVTFSLSIAIIYFVLVVLTFLYASYRRKRNED